jgi:hypothetical protein
MAQQIIHTHAHARTGPWTQWPAQAMVARQGLESMQRRKVPGSRVRVRVCGGGGVVVVCRPVCVCVCMRVDEMHLHRARARKRWRCMEMGRSKLPCLHTGAGRDLLDRIEHELHATAAATVAASSAAIAAASAAAITVGARGCCRGEEEEEEEREGTPHVFFFLLDLMLESGALFWLGCKRGIGDVS